MAEENNTPDTEEATSQVAEETQQDTPTPAEGEEAATTDAQPKDAKEGDTKGEDADGDKSNTMLSDDDGDGSGDDDVIEYDIELPEGFEISEEAEQRITEFAENTAAELGLSNEQLQGLIDWEIQRETQAMETMAADYESRVDSWADEVRSDKELGGDHLNENLGFAKSAIEAFGSETLRSMIDKPSEKNPQGMGLGNHPEFIRLMARVGRALGEDSLVQGEGGQTEPDPGEAHRRLYPSMFKDQ